MKIALSKRESTASRSENRLIEVTQKVIIKQINLLSATHKWVYLDEECGKQGEIDLNWACGGKIDDSIFLLSVAWHRGDCNRDISSKDARWPGLEG